MLTLGRAATDAAGCAAAGEGEGTGTGTGAKAAVASGDTSGEALCANAAPGRAHNAKPKVAAQSGVTLPATATLVPTPRQAIAESLIAPSRPPRETATTSQRIPRRGAVPLHAIWTVGGIGLGCFEPFEQTESG